MYSPPFRQKLLDRLGLLLSMACALHCLVMALLPFVLPSLIKSSCCHDCNELSFHSISAITVFFIALLAFAKPCTLQDKGKLWKLLLGFSFLFAPQYSLALQPYETVLTVSGTALIALAHWQNLMSYKRSESCSDETCSGC